MQEKTQAKIIIKKKTKMKTQSDPSIEKKIEVHLPY